MAGLSTLVGVEELDRVKYNGSRNDGNIRASDGFWNGCYADACVCPRCKRIIVESRK